MYPYRNESSEYPGMNNSTHYSLAMDGDILGYAQEAADKIGEITSGHPERALLVYTGMSGTSSATAIITLQLLVGKKSQQIYVRKENESSHGRTVERNHFHVDRDIHCLVFVDDSVQSGKTLKTVLANVYRQFPDLQLVPLYCLLQEHSRRAFCWDDEWDLTKWFTYK